MEPRGSTALGLSFRPLQAGAFGLDPRLALNRLLELPFQTIRLAAYWNRLEPEPGAFRPEELDWQVDAAERAGKRVVLCVGAVKAFGYPEFFVPDHRLSGPLPEGSLIEPTSHPSLLAASAEFVQRVVERYRTRHRVAAWQLEHEPVDPLGMEHSWRLSVDFVAEELAALRRSDPARPVIMNGFLPTSLAVRLQQWWRTRDQGDSLAAAGALADVVGIDYYPRHALAGDRGLTLYLTGGLRGRPAVGAPGRRLMFTESQAEPWEAVTVPPSPQTGGMYSCLPEDVIANYNDCMRWARRAGVLPEAYLFWGAEYWLLREDRGDASYLDAFRRVLDRA